MAGNSFGRYVRITTFGESHGPALGVVMDGVRPGMRFDAAAIQRELDRRRPGQSTVTTPRREPDRVEVLSGVFEGKTTGMPICMIIRNTDQRPVAYEKIKALFRPGHALHTYLAKYGIADYRGGGRSSGRETVARVAAGALAKSFLSERGIAIVGHTVEVAGIAAQEFDESVIEQNPLRCADLRAAGEMERAIAGARADGDSVGGIVEVRVRSLPAGLGEPVFDKLGADLAHALMTIGAVRGVEFGNGFAAARLRGSQNNDPLYYDPSARRVRSRTNNAGGMAGGISTGEDLVMRIAVKPTSSIRRPQETTTVDGRPARISVHLSAPRARGGIHGGPHPHGPSHAPAHPQGRQQRSRTPRDAGVDPGGHGDPQDAEQGDHRNARKTQESGVVWTARSDLPRLILALFFGSLRYFC